MLVHGGNDQVCDLDGKVAPKQRDGVSFRRANGKERKETVSIPGYRELHVLKSSLYCRRQLQPLQKAVQSRQQLPIVPCLQLQPVISCLQGDEQPG